MVSELDIWRAANLLIRQHDPVYCARRLLLLPTVLKRFAHPAGGSIPRCFKAVV